MVRRVRADVSALDDVEKGGGWVMSDVIALMVVLLFGPPLLVITLRGLFILYILWISRD